MEALADERIGIGRYFTHIFATKSVRNGWDFYDWENNLIRHPEIFKHLYKGRFFTEQIFWVKYELIYGISFLLKYWSGHDKYHLPPPNKPPIAYKAFPPTYIIPTNITDTDLLWEDPARWKFRGGKYKTSEIHPDRIEILCTRPNPHDWIGYSVFEPIYLPACAYMNLMVHGTKMAAKAGNVATAFKMSVPNPSLAMYTEFKQIVDDMKADLTFVLGRDEEIEFMDTKIGAGLAEFGEFLKEDMAAGTGLPLNQVYGRADGGGLQGAGALISKQGELETISNYQADLADNYWEFINNHWNIEDEFVKFRLDFQKSDRARYEEEALQWDNQLKKDQHEQIALQNLMTAIQFQQFMENPELMNQQGNNEDNNGKNGGNGKVPDQSGGSIPDATGIIEPKNKGNNNQSGLQQIRKANQDFIESNLQIFNRIRFKPRIIDADFREDKK